MKIVNIIGGIGNQMFQYALAMALAEKFPQEEIFIDISHFNHYDLHDGFQIENVFHCDLPIADKYKIRKVSRYLPNYKWSRIARKLLSTKTGEYLEKEAYVYDPNVFHVSTDCYYEGYWQSPKYFDSYRQKLLSKFSFTDNIDDRNKRLLTSIRSPNSVAIHIRRGDYVHAANFNGICTLEYYRQAIAHCQNKIKNPEFFIFSNDIDWCRANIEQLTSPSSTYYIDHNSGANSHLDMQLMSNAACCIIANSSFSWWSAWLNNRPNKIIIAPKKWAHSSESMDIYPLEWVLI